MGYVIKLLAVGKRSASGLELRVSPTLLQSDHPLASVGDVFNAIFIQGDAVGGGHMERVRQPARW